MRRLLKITKYAAAIICILACMPMHAQNAMSVLDASAAAIKKCGDVRASFTATTFASGNEQGSSEGYICVSGNKVFLDAGAHKIWYDGRTQWSYSGSTGEVNVSSPDKAEAAKLNPYSFVYIYRRGYSATMNNAKVRGKDCREVKLTSRTAKLKYLYLTIDKATSLPICIRISTNGRDWTRITIHDIRSKQKFSTAMFRFPEKDYPKAEIIDLR